MASPADWGALVAVWIVHPVCPRNRSTGDCPLDWCFRVGVRNLFDGLGISSSRTSVLNDAADLSLGGGQARSDGIAFNGRGA